MTLDELRNLDLKTAPDWTRQRQFGLLAVMVAALLVAAWFLLLGPQRDEIAAAEAREAELKTSYTDKRHQLANLEMLQAQLAEIEKSYGSLLRQLPTKAEMASVLAEINQAGVGRGLQFELFRPGQEVAGPELAELPIEIRLTGSYSDLATFVSDLSKMPRIVTLANITLTPGGKDGRLTMQAIAKTYRTLEPEEKMAQQQAQKQGAKP